MGIVVTYKYDPEESCLNTFALGEMLGSQLGSQIGLGCHFIIIVIYIILSSRSAELHKIYSCIIIKTKIHH